MSELVGIWNLNPSIKWENETQLDKIDASECLRRAAFQTIPTMNISNKENHWTILTCVGLKKLKIKFSEDEEFDEKDVNGNILKSIVNKEDQNKLVHLQKDESGNVKMKITREVIEGKLVQTFSFGNNNIKKTFTRIA